MGYTDIAAQLKSTAERAGRINEELKELKKKEQEYKGSVIVYRDSGYSTKMGLIKQADFSNNKLHITNFIGNQVTITLSATSSYKIFPKEEFLKEL